MSLVLTLSLFVILLGVCFKIPNVHRLVLAFLTTIFLEKSLIFLVSLSAGPPLLADSKNSDLTVMAREYVEKESLCRFVQY